MSVGGEAVGMTVCPPKPSDSCSPSCDIWAKVICSNGSWACMSIQHWLVGDWSLAWVKCQNLSLSTDLRIWLKSRWYNWHRPQTVTVQPLFFRPCSEKWFWLRLGPSQPVLYNFSHPLGPWLCESYILLSTPFIICKIFSQITGLPRLQRDPSLHGAPLLLALGIHVCPHPCPVPQSSHSAKEPQAAPIS